MMNYIKTIFNTYKNQPKFAFGFHGELSHDSYNDIGVVDDDLYSWVKDLYDFGHLNNTILILMSDHGHRYEYFLHVNTINPLYLIYISTLCTYTSNRIIISVLQIRGHS